MSGQQVRRDVRATPPPNAARDALAATATAAALLVVVIVWFASGAGHARRGSPPEPAARLAPAPLTPPDTVSDSPAPEVQVRAIWRAAGGGVYLRWPAESSSARCRRSVNRPMVTFCIGAERPTPYHPQALTVVVRMRGGDVECRYYGTPDIAPDVALSTSRSEVTTACVDAVKAALHS